MNILIVTPCFNSETLIAKTLDSVLAQKTHDIDITYCVVDGGSTDGTVDILKSYEQLFSRAGISFSFLSEKDSGMYDALAKGFLCFKNSDFDWYAYINAGDFYAPRAFFNLRASTRFDDQWVTGINVLYNHKGDIIGARLPGPYYRRLIDHGVFGSLLPCIQQESTFWRSGAHNLIDFELFRKLKLAGDFFLWKSFSKKYELKVISVWLSGFSIHEGQLSEVRRSEYYQELKHVSGGVRLTDYVIAFFVGIFWSIPSSLKLKFFPDRIRPLG